MNYSYLLFLLLSLPIFAQLNPYRDADFYPKGEFVNPLGIKNLLSGNFAELRNNHFHGGLDIKTNQREGYNLYAVGDGYISRINVSPRGYGNAIYIDHPNGYTTVYAHMQRFNDEITAYVRKKQYEQESFAVELYPKKDELKVSQKDIIGLSGNSGGSGGPHLHFEIRHTETEEPVNPFFFGFGVADTQRPSINGLYLYPINGNVAGKTSRYKLPSGLNFQSPIYVSGKVGVGVKAYDKHNGAANNNGVHRIQVEVNGETYFMYTAARFSFDHSRAINALCDYEARQVYNSWIYQCFMDEGNPLRMVTDLKNNGIIDAKEGERYAVKITVSDFAGNQQTASYTLIGKAEPVEGAASNSQKFIRWNQNEQFTTDNIQIDFEPGTLYEDTELTYRYSNGKHYVHDYDVAVHKYFTLALEPEGISSALLDKAVIVRQYKKRGAWRKSYIPADFVNGKVVGKSKDFGVFSVEVDNTPPTITSLNVKENSTFTSSASTMRFSINDSQTDIADYDAYIDGKWVLAEYDKKIRRLTIDLQQEGIPAGTHAFELIVKDEKNNSRTFTATIRKV